MYFLSIIAFVLGILFMFVTSGMSLGGLGMMINFIDLNTFLILILFTFPILVSSGLLKDFINAFRLVVAKKKAESLTEIKKAVEAVELVGKTILYVGVFVAIFSAVSCLISITDLSGLGPYIMVASLSLVYALAFGLLLLPLKYKLRMMSIEYMQEQE